MRIEIGDGALRVNMGARWLTLSLSPAPPDEHTDYVVFIDDIDRWDAPHDDEEVDVEALPRIFAAIEAEFDRRGETVEFE